MNDVTRIRSAIEQGDAHAAEQLLQLVYDELRKLAAERMSQEKPGQTLQATALVHEDYLRPVGGEQTWDWDARRHFYAAAAEAMRRTLVDNPRRQHRRKRKADQQRIADEAAVNAIASPVPDLVALDDASEVRGRQDCTSQIVKLKDFAGRSIPESSGVLGIALCTIDRHRAYDRAWLHQELFADGVPGLRGCHRVSTLGPLGSIQSPSESVGSDGPEGRQGTNRDPEARTLTQPFAGAGSPTLHPLSLES